MDTRDLQSFVAIYQGGSINRAAKELFVSPQGLGKTLRRLEAELGVTLFERDHNGMSPTPAADTLYQHSSRLLDEFGRIQRAFHLGGGAVQRTLRVAFAYGVLTYFGVDVTRSFEREHEHVTIDLAELDDDQIAESLRSGKVEIAVTAAPVDLESFDARFLSSVRHVALVHKDHPLAARDSLSYADLDGETVILIGRGFRPFQNNLMRLARAGAVPERLIETGEIHKIGQFVNRGIGIGISVDHEARDVPFPNVKILPFEEEDATWDLYVARLADATPDPLVAAFATHLTDHVREGRSEFLSKSSEPAAAGGK